MGTTLKHLFISVVIIVGISANHHEASTEDQCCPVRCPQFWAHFGDHCYRLFSLLRSWNAAEAHCQTFLSPSGMGHLASVHSEVENHYLFELQRTSLLRLSNDVRHIQTWIGLVKDDGWSDGSSYNYHYNWHGVPSALPYTYMIESTQGENGWNRMASNIQHGRSYICKMPIINDGIRGVTRVGGQGERGLVYSAAIWGDEISGGTIEKEENEIERLIKEKKKRKWKRKRGRRKGKAKGKRKRMKGKKKGKRKWKKKRKSKTILILPTQITRGNVPVNNQITILSQANTTGKIRKK